MDAEAKLELEHAIGVQEDLHKEQMEKRSETAAANRRVRAELKRKRKACVAAPPPHAAGAQRPPPPGSDVHLL